MIEELKDYTVYHFNTEEELFIKYKYPEYDEHKKEHDDFIEYIESVNLENIDDNQKMFLKELLEKLFNGYSIISLQQISCIKTIYLSLV